MYQRILVPLDGSELSQLVLPYVEEISRMAKSEIVLLRVCEAHEDSSDPMYHSYLDRLAKSIAGQTGFKDDVMSTAVVNGQPASEILNYSEHNHADLIAMSTHGRSGVERWFMGSVATKVFGNSTTPVLIVRPRVHQGVTPKGWPGRNVVVPLDGSSRAEMVLPHASFLAREKGAELILLRICEPPVIPSDRSPAIQPSWEEHRDQIIAALKSQAAAYLDAKEKELKKQGVKARSEVIMGNAAEEIADYTNKANIDLIALTTHGRSGMGRWMYGSVAAKLLSSIAIPILLINARASQTTEK